MQEVMYRVTQERFLEVYTGTGASYRDGARWNQSGDPVLYFASSASLAMLEMSHYLPSPRHVPDSYRLGIYEVDVPQVDHLDDVSLPENWDRFPYPASTQAIGSEWLQSRRGLILKVPSCAVPGGLEKIAVVNPLHEGIKGLRLIEAIPATYNPRVFQQL